MVLEVTHCGLEHLRPICELPQPRIALETEHPSHLPCSMVVIDMLGRTFAAQGAHSALDDLQLNDFLQREAVPTTPIRMHLAMRLHGMQ